ncbi:DUF7093 family protein [Halocatena halophila]|uniref:DUF7093 family protein n=1 Tax=Halocatena halophila TaxID=2814576 RepID=UPI002ED5DA78
MGFKCSVLGHRFEEPELITERERRGNEVITVRRRVMDCSICGEQRILAERKEITSQTREGGDQSSAEKTTVPTDTEQSTPTSESADAEATVDETATGETDHPTADGWTERDEPAPPADDDAVILSSDSTSADGQWAHDRGTKAEISISGDGTARATGSGETQLAEPISPASDDGEIITTGPTAPTDTTPEEESTTQSVAVLECVHCSFDVRNRDSPFRAGDLCPHCHETYLSSPQRMSTDNESTG